jgi:hypothetical protein
MSETKQPRIRLETDVSMRIAQVIVDSPDDLEEAVRAVVADVYDRLEIVAIAHTVDVRIKTINLRLRPPALVDERKGKGPV